MSLWSRLVNIARGDRLSREIDDELQAHLEEGAAQGRDPGDARRALGSPLHLREQSRDARLIPWLDSLRADAVFGWRQLKKNKVTSAAAILSLGLAIGACTSAFRLIDALLLRPLPVANAERLYLLNREALFDGKMQSYDAWAYPCFVQMRAAVKDQAELIAIAYAAQMDLSYKSDQEMEKAYVQPVSGWMFTSFGLNPAVGRLLTEDDDRTPRAHPYAVLSYDYWTRRFGQDPQAVGRTFRLGDDLFQVVGVAGRGFTGTEPGTMTDIFIPTMMHPAVTHSDWTWFRTLALLKPGVAIEPVRAKLSVTSHAWEEERSKGFTGMTKASIAAFLDQRLVLEPAAAGASGLQQNYRGSLAALGVLVALVLLIACANVANLMTAQAAARAREMALRVSIGAGRGRLVQLVLIESAWIAFLAAGLGAAFAWWAAPFVVGMINPPDNPARLALPADWRVVGFGVALTLAVTFLFGLAPALRASSVKPSSALKGGSDPRSRRRLMHGLIGVQVAFCFLVLFVAGLFSATFDHLSHKPTGFSAERLLVLDTVTERAQPPVFWDQVTEHLRELPGVEDVAYASRTLLDDSSSWNGFVSIQGAPPGPILAYFLSAMPGWIGVMKIPLLDGRDFRPADTSPGMALVNETFVRQFFNGESPIGKSIVKGTTQYQVIGVVGDAPYRNMREAMLPSVYVPFRSLDANGAVMPIRSATLMVRTKAGNPVALASTLRREVPRARPEFRVSNIHTQADLVRAQTIRERLLATMGMFFAGVALLLAAIGLYGVLDYSVFQRRRELGIRIAIGARAGDIARRVTAEVFAMVVVGALAGVGLGIGSVRYIEALLYQVRATDWQMLAVPSIVIVAATLLAALPAVFHAVRIDPVTMLRAE